MGTIAGAFTIHSSKVHNSGGSIFFLHW